MSIFYTKIPGKALHWPPQLSVEVCQVSASTGHLVSAPGDCLEDKTKASRLHFYSEKAKQYFLKEQIYKKK